MSETVIETKEVSLEELREKEIILACQTLLNHLPLMRGGIFLKSQTSCMIIAVSNLLLSKKIKYKITLKEEKHV